MAATLPKLPRQDVISLSRSDVAGRFFLLSLGLGTGSIALVWLLSLSFGSIKRPDAPWTLMAAVFAVSSGLLLAGSCCLTMAVTSVRRERQPELRRSLVAGLASGSAFIGIQAYGLALYMGRLEMSAANAQTGADPFAAVLVVLHAMHFAVALLFLAYVTVLAFAGRYDHEYYWGVTVAAWFWHFLGIVWMAVLFVLIVVAGWHAGVAP